MSKYRVFFKHEGDIDSCIIQAKSKKNAKKILKENLPSAIIGIADKIDEKNS